MEFLIAAGGVGLVAGALVSSLLGWLRRRPAPVESDAAPVKPASVKPGTKRRRPAPVESEPDEHDWLIKRKHLHDGKPCLEMYCSHCSDTKHKEQDE